MTDGVIRGSGGSPPGTIDGSRHEQQPQYLPMWTSTVSPSSVMLDGLASLSPARVPAMGQSGPEGQAFPGSALVLQRQESSADVLPRHGIVQTPLPGHHAIGPNAPGQESYEAQTAQLLSIFNRKAQLLPRTKRLYVRSMEVFFKRMGESRDPPMLIDFVNEISGCSPSSINLNQRIVDYLSENPPCAGHLLCALQQMWMAVLAEERDVQAPAEAEAPVNTQAAQSTARGERLSLLTPKQIQEANVRLLGSKLEPRLSSRNAEHGTIFSDVITKILSSDCGLVQGPKQSKESIVYGFEGVQTSSGLLVNARLTIAPGFEMASLVVETPHARPQATYVCVCDMSPA